MVRRARFPRDFLAGTIKSWRQVRNFLVTSRELVRRGSYGGSLCNGNWALSYDADVVAVGQAVSKYVTGPTKSFGMLGPRPVGWERTCLTP